MLSRVFNGIDDERLSTYLVAFADPFRKESAPAEREIVCIDGKETRGTEYENGRNPDIISAYSCHTGLTLATDLCDKKSNEIKSVPRLLDKIDIQGCVVMTDAMSFQKAIIDRIRQKDADFVIELKANQRSLCYGLEDRIKTIPPLETYTEDPVLSHGGLRQGNGRIYHREALITEKDKWTWNLTVVEILTETIKKSDGQHSSEQRLYFTSLDDRAVKLNMITRRHWSVECLHSEFDRNLRQDSIKRKTERSANNLYILQ